MLPARIRRAVLGAGLVAAAAVAPVLAPVAAWAETRVALVIGNADYEHSSPLRNTRNDAEAMAAKLRDLGFETVEGYDLSYDGMRRKIRDFARISRTSDVALFFYAGHGIAVENNNYLVPVDARFEDETALEYEFVSVDRISAQMATDDNAVLLLLDACRNNPKLSQAPGLGAMSRAVSVGGLAAMESSSRGRGMGIVFATAPGETASDGEGDHSPFTTVLLEQLDTPGAPFTSLIVPINKQVQALTQGKQKPFFRVSFNDHVILNDLPPEDVGGVEVASLGGGDDAGAADLDLAYAKDLFDIARETGDLELYKELMRDYGGTRYGKLAKRALLAAKRQAAKEAEVEKEELETASLNPTGQTGAPSGDASRAILREPTGPLMLAPGQSMRMMPATQLDQQQLALSKNKRREVQARLNALGLNVGYPDGAFGPKTRRGITAWQQSQGLPPTGFLNLVQLNLLTVQSEATYVAHLNPVRAAPARKAAAAPAPKKQEESSGGNLLTEAFKGFAKGIGEGLGKGLVD